MLIIEDTGNGQWGGSVPRGDEDSTQGQTRQERHNDISRNDGDDYNEKRGEDAERAGDDSDGVRGGDREDVPVDPSADAEGEVEPVKIGERGVRVQLHLTIHLQEAGAVDHHFQAA